VTERGGEPRQGERALLERAAAAVERAGARDEGRVLGGQGFRLDADPREAPLQTSGRSAAGAEAGAEPRVLGGQRLHLGPAGLHLGPAVGELRLRGALALNLVAPVPDEHGGAERGAEERSGDAEDGRLQPSERAQALAPGRGPLSRNRDHSEQFAEGDRAPSARVSTI
jgi:hypothetical protein